MSVYFWLHFCALSLFRPICSSLVQQPWQFSYNIWRIHITKQIKIKYNYLLQSWDVCTMAAISVRCVINIKKIVPIFLSIFDQLLLRFFGVCVFLFCSFARVRCHRLLLFRFYLFVNVSCVRIFRRKQFVIFVRFQSKWCVVIARVAGFVSCKHCPFWSSPKCVFLEVKWARKILDFSVSVCIVSFFLPCANRISLFWREHHVREPRCYVCFYGILKMMIRT